MESINLDGWKTDERFSPYPEGSRDKYALIAPETPQHACVIPNHRYLMKFSNPRYPVQFWSEVIAEIIGRYVSVQVPACHYAEDVNTNEPGSLIEWFYGDAVEARVINYDLQTEILVDQHDPYAPVEVPSTYSLYVPGSNYMARQIEDYDLKTGKQHNLKHVGYLLTNFRRKWQQNYWPYWAKLLTFDAIIGNTDRHQDNWGVLWRTDAQGVMAPRFAPAFDNGTSLLHEITEPNLARFNDREVLERYVRRGTHHIRWEITDAKPAGHLALIEKLVTSRWELRDIIAPMLEVDQTAMYAEIAALEAFPSSVPLSSARIEAICAVVKMRIEILRNIIGL